MRATISRVTWAAVISLTCALLTPDIGQHAQPILAHDFANLGLRPAGAFHCSSQIGKVAYPAYPNRVDDIAERARYPPPIPLVMANILEKRIILILGEVGPDPNILLTRDADHVVHRRDVILDGRVVFPGEEGRET
jgi:hypothetical protein